MNSLRRLGFADWPRVFWVTLSVICRRFLESGDRFPPNTGG